jgi:hypothetical protein
MKSKKMKNQYTYLLFACAILFSSCKKEFLNQTPPTGVPVPSAIKTENDMADAVNGMYNAMYTSTLFGTDIPVLGDLLADNVYISSNNAAIFLNENNYSVSPTTQEPLDIYSQGYYAILQANRIIAAPLPSSDNVSQLKGEAYISRALIYLELVNFFGEPFTVDPTAMGVPLVIAPINPGTALTTKPARATVSQIYTRIISDLDSAYGIMPATGTTLHPVNSEYLSKYAAKAIESRVYLYKGDYPGAVAAALLVINNGGYSLVAPGGLISYWGNPGPTSGSETIFELALTAQNNNFYNGMDDFYEQNGHGEVLVTPALYNLYSSADERKALILTSSPVRGNVLVCNKYTNSPNPDDKDDIKIIRYAEVLLTLAESDARTGDIPDALKYLNMVAQNRDPSSAEYASTGNQLITDILNERRKELAFEGLRYFDLTRLNLTIVRPQVGPADSAPSIGLISVGDTRRILPIPQAEIDANPNIKQNPGY